MCPNFLQKWHLGPFFLYSSVITSSLASLFGGAGFLILLFLAFALHVYSRSMTVSILGTLVLAPRAVTSISYESRRLASR